MNTPSEFPLLPEPPELSAEEAGYLARSAAGAIQSEVSGSVEEDARPGVEGRPEEVPLRLQERLGAFVTIFRGEGLRGCLGNAEGREPLYLAVPRLARAAVSRDHRFTPVTPDELPGIRVELSLLGALTLLPGHEQVLLADLDPMRCGVYLHARGRTGLLLPQVARRLGWSARELLDQVCVKAGLPPDAWRDPDARLFGFTAGSRDLLAAGDLPQPSHGAEP